MQETRTTASLTKPAGPSSSWAYKNTLEERRRFRGLPAFGGASGDQGSKAIGKNRFNLSTLNPER
jgi:hypothetical protein